MTHTALGYINAQQLRIILSKDLKMTCR